SRNKTSAANRLESTEATRAALGLIVRDLRSAGFGTDRDWAALPQPPIAYVDSIQILINANFQPYPDTAATHMPPLAYDPAGLPRPFPVSGTSWEPPIKYRTGAEVVRWTLDANNDGVVDQ